MKKKLGIITLVVMVIALSFSLVHKENKDGNGLLLSNIEALAQDEWDWPQRPNGVSSVNCKIDKYWDPDARMYIERVTLICSGFGFLVCSC